jgi:hypothetical protein
MGTMRYVCPSHALNTDVRSDGGRVLCLLYTIVTMDMSNRLHTSKGK